MPHARDIIPCRVEQSIHVRSPQVLGAGLEAKPDGRTSVWAPQPRRASPANAFERTRGSEHAFSAPSATGDCRQPLPGRVSRTEDGQGISGVLGPLDLHCPESGRIYLVGYWSAGTLGFTCPRGNTNERRSLRKFPLRRCRERDRTFRFSDPPWHPNYGGSGAKLGSPRGLAAYRPVRRRASVLVGLKVSLLSPMATENNPLGFRTQLPPPTYPVGNSQDPLRSSRVGGERLGEALLLPQGVGSRYSTRSPEVRLEFGRPTAVPSTHLSRGGAELAPPARLAVAVGGAEAMDTSIIPSEGGPPMGHL